MKLSKKLRFLFSLTALFVCLFVGTVTIYADVLPMQEEETTTLSAEDAKTYANGKITVADIKTMVEEYVTGVAQIATYSQEELEYMEHAMAAQTDVYSKFADVVGDEPCGAYKSCDNTVINEVEGKDAVDVETVLHFEKKDLKMTLHVTCFDSLGIQITSTEFSLADQGEESFASKMADAAANTLMGMGVVFFILIFISLIISCFTFIPMITEKMENRKAGKVETVSNTSVTDEGVQTPVTEEDDTELIAVIAAAIAASEHTSTDSFVVRSIRRR